VRSSDDPAACLKKYGLKRAYYAWDPEYIPGADPCLAMRDLLHLFPDGLLRSEAAWLFYILFRMGLSIDAVNAAIRSYRHFPADVRVPSLVPKLKEGKAGRPRSEAVLRMTGSQVMWFSLHSITILKPLLTEEMLAHPAWASWCKLVELFSAVIQHKHQVSDVERIDDLQLEYNRLFNLVPDYVGRRRPKHHFLSHLATDVWNWGPLRGVWCFGFESFNRVIKRGARRSNFKHETMSCMQYWSMWSARQLVSEYCGTLV